MCGLPERIEKSGIEWLILEQTRWMCPHLLLQVHNPMGEGFSSLNIRKRQIVRSAVSPSARWLIVAEKLNDLRKDCHSLFGATRRGWALFISCPWWFYQTSAFCRLPRCWPPTPHPCWECQFIYQILDFCHCSTFITTIMDSVGSQFTGKPTLIHSFHDILMFIEYFTSI